MTGSWLLLLLLPALAWGGDDATYRRAPEDAAILLPDPTVTPGGVRTEKLSMTAVCETRWGKDARHVTEAMKTEVYRRYGAVKTAGICCEVDHLIPRELGGADDLANLWPQPWRQARMKDRLENALHREVCAGLLPIEEARTTIAVDWYAAWQRRFAPRLPPRRSP